ncbi:MAG: helix-turn-helix domain-containing protein [Victivallaceae bacterium]
MMGRYEFERMRRRRLAAEAICADVVGSGEQELNHEEAARKLGMRDAKTLKNLADRGEAPFHMVGRRRVFFLSELQGWYREFVQPGVRKC